MWQKGVASGEFPEDAPTKGIVKLDYYISKFGANRLPPMMERLEGAMVASGIEGFSMGGNTGPTLDGHRLATYAEKEGLEKQNAFMEEIFKRYFCQEQAPCDREVLLAGGFHSCTLHFFVACHYLNSSIHQKARAAVLLG